MARLPVRVFFDTTVLCAGILNLDGLCMHLLELTHVGIIQGVVSTEVIAEFDRNCRIGLGSNVLDDEDTIEFCALLSPLLDLQSLRQSKIGRAMGPMLPIMHTGLVRIGQPPAGLPITMSRMIDASTLALKDPFDLHVVATTLANDCHYLCTSNSRDLPDGLTVNEMEFIRPERLYPLLLATSRQ